MRRTIVILPPHSTSRSDFAEQNCGLQKNPLHMITEADLATNIFIITRRRLFEDSIVAEGISVIWTWARRMILNLFSAHAHWLGIGKYKIKEVPLAER
jgi:hypothetical protein